MQTTALEDFQHQFQASVSTYHASRLLKLRRGHAKLVYSKLLELAAKKLGVSFRRRARLVWGEEMTVVYPEINALGISRYGFYEEGLTRMVLAHVEPGMTFLDVGANVGYFSLLAAWLVGGTGQVHSFEPTPTTFEVLQLNLGLKPNVRLNKVAVGSQSGTATLNDYGPSLSGYNSMYTARMVESALKRINSTKFEATVISLDEYVAQESLSPNFVKINAESNDYQILLGMEETLNRCHPAISVEVGDMDVEGVPSSRDLVLYLANKGYHPFEFSGGRIIRHQLKERYEYGDILFLPEYHGI